MSQLRVLDLMTKDVLTISEHESLEVAEQIMEAGRVHHLPVVSHGQLIGIVTQDDLLRAAVSMFAEPSPTEESELKRSIPVSMVMSARVTTVAPDTPALRAAELLRRHKFGCLPVVDGSRLVGIVTEGDFVDLVIHALRADHPTLMPQEPPLDNLVALRR
ncbi:MAG: CBS domain-containing protein [Deltaproteobacteria bacterium]|nr:CBS domain-containing protein [Deltaproteobacteria bacterium]